jgi:hypothetical protein
MRRPPRSALFLLCLCAPAAWAQVRHCTTPEGIDVYTDRRCEDLGAAPAVPRPATPAPGATYRAGCARTVRDLAFSMQAAIDHHDPNRLADSYLWTGMSTQAGYAVLDRLDAIAQRPLADIVPVYGGGANAALYPQETTTRVPVALRLDQTEANGTTPVSTVLALRRHLDCWWVSF